VNTLSQVEIYRENSELSKIRPLAVTVGSELCVCVYVFIVYACACVCVCVRVCLLYMRACVRV